MRAIAAVRLLVCGGRDFDDLNLLYGHLDAARRAAPPDGFMIIEGGARGADTLARRWAVDRKVPFEHYPADWDHHGNRAGPIRNQRMLEKGRPTAVMAFSGGRGTADMVRRARAAGVPIIEIPGGAA